MGTRRNKGLSGSMGTFMGGSRYMPRNAGCDIVPWPIVYEAQKKTLFKAKEELKLHFDEYLFCTGCGTKIIRTDNKIRKWSHTHSCEACRKASRNGDRCFCPLCGCHKGNRVDPEHRYADYQVSSWRTYVCVGCERKLAKLSEIMGEHY